MARDLTFGSLTLKCVKSAECGTSKQLFEQALKIYVNKPQVVNKWVAGSVKLTKQNLDESERQICEQFLKSAAISDSLEAETATDKVELELREFLSKSSKIFKNFKYLLVNDRENIRFAFIPLLPSSAENGEPNDQTKYASISRIHAFEFDAESNRVNLYVDTGNSDDAVSRKQIKWLQDNLMPKILNWCLTVKLEEDSTCTHLNTLKLYENMVEDYINLYQQLKSKYWPMFSPDWFALTNTDPEKFIHEDVSIASYLILAWKHLKCQVKCFVDLGCGNGLLVYILNDQGFNGYGIDMRARRIWKNQHFVDAETRLVEKSIDPRFDVYEDCDWLIGNHSDELSPWLPLMTIKTSQLSKSPCHMFLIPCCFFDFTAKFEVKLKNESRYDTYLSFLEKICRSCNLEFYRDKLRIPSTKNVCFICLNRRTADDFERPLAESLDESVDEKICERVRSCLNNAHEIQFVQRDLEMEKLKSSRNCTKNVSNDIKVLIVTRVLDFLLMTDEPEAQKERCVFLDKSNGSKWNAGISKSLGEVAQLFDRETLTKLKQECGGIKTLLKNYHQLFAMGDKDQVKLRVWQPLETKQMEPDAPASETEGSNKKRKRAANDSKDTSGAKAAFRTKQCLFDLYHPSGCNLEDSECRFIHSNKNSVSV